MTPLRFWASRESCGAAFSVRSAFRDLICMGRHIRLGRHMDIKAWLRGVGLDQYEAAFCDNEIDDKVLPSLTDDDLKDLGITSLGTVANCSMP
jgi:SAM domain (Sterile alpha motif)